MCSVTNLHCHFHVDMLTNYDCKYTIFLLIPMIKLIDWLTDQLNAWLIDYFFISLLSIDQLPTSASTSTWTRWLITTANTLYSYYSPWSNWLTDWLTKFLIDWLLLYFSAVDRSVTYIRFHFHVDIVTDYDCKYTIFLLIPTDWSNWLID